MQGAEEIGQAILDHFAQVVVGQDPFDTERIWDNLWQPKLVGRRGITTRVISGIDIALWDLKGQVTGLPVYKLLGGFTNKVPVYIAGGYYEEGKGTGRAGRGDGRQLGDGRPCCEDEDRGRADQRGR